MATNGIPFKVEIIQNKHIFEELTKGVKVYDVKYTGSDGKDKVVKKYGTCNLPYYTAFNGYSTEEKPHLTPEDIFKIKVDLTKKTNGTGYVMNSNSFDSIERIDFFSLLDLYSNENSDGGKIVTPKEQADIIETFSKWY